MNRRKTISLFLSIAIHLLLLSLLWSVWHDHKNKMLSASSAKRVDISLEDFITPPPSRPKTASGQKATPPVPSPKKPKSAPNKPPKPPKQAKQAKDVKEVKRVKRSPEKTKKRPTPPKRTDAKRVRPTKTPPRSVQPQRTETPKSAPVQEERSIPTGSSPQKGGAETPSPLSKLAGALGAPAMPVQPQPPSIEQISDALSDREFTALYKDDFDRFTPEQKRFIKDNLSRIQGITQHYLTRRGYPYTAVRLGQQGMNIVEFDLHPNGDITDLRVIQGSGSSELDKNSLDTIKTAYKDYPRPTETTKIRFYIHYRLY